MNTTNLQRRINLVRRDIGNLLFHFTRTPDEGISDNFDTAKRIVTKSAYSVLNNIISEGKLRGSSKNIRGGYNCVCFSEAPITELAALFALVEIANYKNDMTRYEPYGVAVRKEWLFSKGGRLVIYQPESEFELLPEELRNRHVRYEPTREIDYTWEREWRIQIDELELDPKETLLIVPDVNTAFELTYTHVEYELDYDNDPSPIGSYPVAKWMVVSLDLFGFKME